MARRRLHIRPHSNVEVNGLKKYTEIGFGNTWFIRTEFEDSDGTEREVRGFTAPFKLQSVYFRLWMGKKVIILDSKEGLKLSSKNRKNFKLVIGFMGI